MNNSAIINEFLVESIENLSNINDQLTKYEKNPDDRELLNEIFRAVHTIKGSASFLNFKNLKDLTHTTENILDQIRDDKLKLNPEITDILLESFDACMAIVKQIEADGEEGSETYAELKSRLDDIEAGKVLGVENEQNVGVSSESGPSVKADADQKLANNVFEESADQLNLIKEIESAAKAAPEPVAPAPVEEVKTEKVAVTAEKPVESATKTNGSATTAKPTAKPTAPAPAAKRSEGSVADSVVRVNVKLLDKIMNVVGELVLNRNQILQYSTRLESPELTKLSHQLNVITSELQNDIMTTRMQPIGSVINKFERVIRDLARSQKKKIKLTITGQETELDKTLLEAIKDPLTHLIRNSVDHGMEFPEERLAIGKPEEGNVQIRAFHEGGQVNIEIQDDGRGINPEIILRKAIEKGVITHEQAEHIGEQEAVNLIFAPGFSTAEQVTDISGRGVGMDVVRTNIEKIGGMVDVTSVVGESTTLRLRIPLTLAIVPSLLVRSNHETFAIPQINLVELVRLEDKERKDIEQIHEASFYRLRGDLIPIFNLSEKLDLEKVNKKTKELSSVVENITSTSSSKDQEIHLDEQDAGLNIVILNAEGNVYGVVVDEILDTEEIVVKPLPRSIKNLDVYAGATIKGDGTVSLIMDVMGFYTKHARKEIGHQNLRSIDSNGSKKNFDSEELLLIRLCDQKIYAVPLALVNRLEEFTVGDIEMTGSQPIIRYRDMSMPLVNIEDKLLLGGNSILSNMVDRKTDKKHPVPCFVVKKNHRYFGFVVEEILDIAQTTSDLDVNTIDREGIAGTMFVEDNILTVLDLDKILVMMLGESVASPAKDKTILLVDDSSYHRALCSEILMGEGYEIITAVNGSEGVSKLKQNLEKVDLIISDIEMPEMNGWEFAKTVKGDESLKHIPMIALTTRTSTDDKKAGVDVGFDSHIKKFVREEIIDELSKFLG